MSLRRIVAVSNDTEIQQMARRVARELFLADDLSEAYDIIETVDPDMVILDHNSNPDHICELLNTTDKNVLHVPVLVVGSTGDNAGLSTKHTQMGMLEYLHDRKDYARLEEIVRTLTDKAKTTNGQTTMRDFFAEDYAASIPIAGRSKAILNTLKMIRLVAASRCNPILIVGETGTGKELAAKAVHNLRHPNEPFVAINCAALTANLLESELFGHVKGSFTGADREKTGLLELAGPGTLFLDEISEMPVDLQAKLLRVLQENRFRRVGGIKDIACNATVIASSNRNLNREVQANRFRRDLYYRLSTYPITIAPLRAPERRDDIRLLAEYFLKTSTICPEKANKIMSLTK
ncbi:MAG: sigma 54-interacting transcriptional regulator, partial [Planctomycetota bacterium]